MTRTRAGSLVAMSAAAAMLLAACGGGGGGEGGGGGGGGSTTASGALADCAANPTTCNAVPAGELQNGGQITYALEKNIQNWNITSSEGNTFDTAVTLRGVLPGTFYTAPNLKSELNTDWLESAEQTVESPQTIVYKIKPEAVWNDGTPISADDFIYNWKVQNGRDCTECEPGDDAGYRQMGSVTGSDGGKTVTVVYSETFTDWKSPWSSGAPLYPAHIAAQQGDLNTPAGLKAAFDYFGATVPTFSAGPYMIENWQDNVALTLVPNPQWYGPIKPKLERLIFRVITDATQEPIALQNNEVQVIYPQPQVDLVEQVRQIPGVSQTQGLGLTWEHYDFNLQNPALQDKALRQALFTAVNVKDIIGKTVGQFNPDVGPLQNHNFVPGQEGYEDAVSQTGQGSGDLEKAKKILTDAGYTGVGTKLVAPSGTAVPDLRIRYTVGNAIRQSQCELFQQYAKALGVNVTISPTDALGTTLSSGDYDVIVFAWVASPFPFGGAQQNWRTGGGGNYGKYSNPQVDALIDQAGGSTDVATARGQLNEANRLMAEDAYVLPLYQKPTFLAVRENIGNVRNNSSLDGPTYNVAEWGIKAG